MSVVDSAADTLSLNDSLTRQPSTSMPENLSATYLAGLATLAVLAIAVLERVTRVSVEVNEPPLLKPKVPVFGHIWSFLQRPSEYFIQLRKIHNVELATLQLAHAKVYVVWSPAVVHSAFRSKTLSHDKYSLDFAQRVFGLSRDTVALLRSPEAVEDRIQQRLMDAIHDGLMGQSLKNMTARALKYLNNQINELGTGSQAFETSNLYIWLRHHITMSVSNTLYGASDPFKKDPSLVQALWDFEGDFTRLLPGKLLGKLLASRAFNGREKVQRAMVDFYRAKSEDNDDVTPFIRTRAELLRQAGLSPDEIGRMEMSFMFVATTGSVPTIFWLLANVLQRRESVEAIRLELEPLVAKQGNTAELRVSSINETSCPLLLSSWHEAIRMSNQFLGTRHPLEDMTVMNAEGRSYVLKQGVPVIWTAGALHASTDAWGDDARVFRADRFVDLQGSDKQKKKASFYPFGGGKHLCPGRVFAYSEILPFASALLLGFDIHGLKPESVATGPTRLGEGVLKPLHEGRDSSCTMAKRKGWDNVQWNLTL